MGLIETKGNPQARLRRLSKAFCALRSPSRLRILEALAEGPSNVINLGNHLRISQPLLSWHLKELRQAGFVVSQREGRKMVYRLCPEQFDEVIRELGSLLRISTPDLRGLNSKE